MVINQTFNSIPTAKTTHKLFLMFLVFLCVSCGPSIHFLGDSHAATNKIDVFYDEKDVEKEYRTIGKMTHDKFIDYHVESIKKAMIKKAKEKGGDGIIFLETNTIVSGEDVGDDRLSITAKVIKYK